MTKVSQLSSPIQINIPTNRTVKIVITVWDEDWFSSDEIRQVTDFILPFSTVSVSDNWKQATETSSNPDMNFTVKYKLTQCDGHFTGLGCNFCDSSYFTELCNKYCAPAVGRYNCTDQGDKVCFANWKGTECDSCALNYYPNGTCGVFCKPVVGQYNCSDQGTKECQGNWNGTDCDSCIADYYGATCSDFCRETAQYKCDHSGHKDCKNNYYPQQLCDLFCEPVSRQYNCSDQGDKVCLGHWNGTECDICINHYYGTDCSKFCNETVQYTCDGSGDKVCKDNFYPKQQCDKSCVSVAGKYNCSDQGDKVCLGHWNGTECDKCINHYYGTDCSKFCNETVQYTCDGSGDKVCKDNFYPKQQCDKSCVSVTGKYNCSDQGDKVCLGHWNGTECDKCINHYYGTDCSKFCNETVQYTCDGSGDKVCKENFYPKQQCDKSCVSVSGKYNCSDQGDKVCLEHWSGTECHSCALNYFRADCSKFCNDTVNYTCDDAGDKNCKENFYPNQQCDTFCKPKTSFYTCNSTTGEKICGNRTIGKQCDQCAVNYYPQGKCDVLCKPEEDKYTCSDDGEKACLKNRASPDCTSCMENYYGKTCTKFCKETTYYNCSEYGDKICVDNSTSVANNCRECKNAM